MVTGIRRGRGRARRTRPARRGCALALVGALLVAGLGALVATSGVLDLRPVCGPGGEQLRMPPGRSATGGSGPSACAHADEPPPGVDLGEPVSTAELRDRPGAGPAVAAAAEDAGVAAPVTDGASSPQVPCDSGSDYRVQAMYVVERGATNRYAQLHDQMQTWAAGVDDVFNRSAALTGGVRHVRYVTDPGGTPGTCVADVLDVTVPPGALATFDSSIQALAKLGYDKSNRKYLVWADVTGRNICGIATMFNDTRKSQANYNNGSYAQYARVDAPCWGGGNGTWQHSVEAHELTHTLGGVQDNAVHSTRAGHCWDEADTMCYADGGRHAMVSVCPQNQEYLLDCNSDDYYSTYPDPGSYLDANWNAAQSRFLIGGGPDATAGSPKVLGARLAVNNPAVPGLATQVAVTPSLPPGRTLTSVVWTSAKTGCTYSRPADPAAAQAQVTCPASTVKATSVTAVLTDSTGAKKTVTAPLTFATHTARPLAAVLQVGGQSSAQVRSASVCTAAPTPVRAVLTDRATGQAVKGLAATFTRKGKSTSTVVAGSAVTGPDGSASTSLVAESAVTYAVKSTATPVYAALAPVGLPVVAARCRPRLEAALSATSVRLGEAVTVTGTLRRTVGAHEIGVSGASMPVTVATTSTSDGRTVTKNATLATARSAADGRFTITVRPTTSGSLSVALPASASYAATRRDLGTVTVLTDAAP